MTEWLVKHFVPNYTQTDKPSVRTAYGKFAGIVGIVLNVLLCIGKGMVGFMAGSVAIIADSVNNLADASSNIVSLLGFKLASLPADLNHPYGHGRFEYLSGLAISVLVASIGIELVVSSIKKILHPTPTDFSLVIAGILLASIVVKFWMASFNNKLGKRIDSETLIATAVDSRNDVISTTAVLGAGIISHVTHIDLDGWVGLFVGGFIIISGIELIWDAVSPLLGKCPSDEMVDYIQQKIMSYPGVLGTHDLMIHDYGPGRQFVSAHVEMAAEVDPLVSHDQIDNIEEDFRNEDHLILTIHYDPIVTNDPKVKEMRTWISQRVKTIDERLTIHDLRTVPGTTHTNVLFDCVVPNDVLNKTSEDDIRKEIATMVETHYPKAIAKVSIDHSYVKPRH